MKIQHLLEMPELVSSENWHLTNSVENKRIANQILDNDPELLNTYTTAKLYHQGGNVGGQVGLISDSTGQLEYYMHYEIQEHKILGHCASQVKVWRSHYSSVVGIASIVFDGWLLKQFDTIISDSYHTDRGREFWITQISGHANSNAVGIIKMDDVIVYDHSINIEEWISQQDAWGQGRKFRNILFFITNKLIG